MSTQLQLRRGTTAETANFIGAAAEVTVDTDNNSLVVHDGITQGGHRVTGDLSFNTNEIVNNAGDIVLTAISPSASPTVSQTWTLGANGQFGLPENVRLFSSGDIKLEPTGNVTLSANHDMVFDMNAYSGNGIVLIDSTEDGYDDPETPSVLNVGKIFHETGVMVIQSDGSITDLITVILRLSA